jgi:predicted alpha/beta hydrolase
MQSASDIFLGWNRITAEDGVARDFYMRQLWDWKLSADLETMLPEGLAIYAQMCGWTLARAHARSGDAIAIGSYLGAGDRFDQAMCRFAMAYADQNQKDYEALKLAIATNKVHAISGV